MPIVAMLIAAAATIAFVAFIFRPMTSAGSDSSQRRFQLVDVFSLVALWQYVLVFVILTRRNKPLGEHPAGEHPGQIAFVVIFLVVMTALWLALTATMSRLGVQRAIKRFVAVAIAAPVGIIAPLVFFVCTWLGSMSIGEDRGTAVAFLVAWCVACVAGVASRAVLIWATRPESMESHRFESQK